MHREMKDVTYKAGDYEAVHELPFWKDKVDFIIASHLGWEAGKSQWEQIPAKRLGSHQFEVCCIPFFAKDLCLGDIVDTNDDFTIISVNHHSGHTTFRVWLAAVNDLNRQKIMRGIEFHSSNIEFSSNNLISVSAPDDKIAKELDIYLQDKEATFGVLYEVCKGPAGNDINC